MYVFINELHLSIEDRLCVNGGMFLGDRRFLFREIPVSARIENLLYMFCIKKAYYCA